MNLWLSPEALAEMRTWPWQSDIGAPDPNTEPVCRCESQQLANFGHDDHCPWPKWNNKRKKEELRS